jgi:putative acetyltransferase
MLIRPLDPFDPRALELLAQSDAFHAALYPAASNHLVDPALLREPAVHFLGVFDGEALLGCGAFRRCGAYAEVKRVFVPDAHRGRGVARALMDALEARMRAEGLALARLETGIYQPAALALYERRGYRQCPPFGDYAPDPLSLFLEKRL